MLKALLLVLAVLSVAHAARSHHDHDHDHDHNNHHEEGGHRRQLQAEFKEFMSKFGKEYSSHAEFDHRFSVFSANMAHADKLNKEQPLAHFGASKFADLSPEEFKAKYLPNAGASEEFAVACLHNGAYKRFPHKRDTPKTWDWRDTAHVVQSVKDQENCGGCWAFSTAANIEGLYGVAGKSVGSLSPQYIIDCSKGSSTEMYQGTNTTVPNNGCHGGWPWTAFNDLATTLEPLPTWDEYPFIDSEGICKGNRNATVGVTISGYNCIDADETAMVDALLASGPLSIALNAADFQLYLFGIMNPLECNQETLDHAVLLVGYGVQEHLITADVHYWIVKNSWGSSWGEDGYVLIHRGSNVCGINNAVSCGYI